VAIIVQCDDRAVCFAQLLQLDKSGRGVQSSGVLRHDATQPLLMFESARLFALNQFKFFLEADHEGLHVPDLLSAETEIMAFTQELGRALLEQFVATRLAQVQQHPPVCECGRAMTPHRMTAWTHKSTVA